GLTDIKSWLFFAIGCVFSAAALIDGIHFTDPCPGYAELQRRVLRAHDDYIDTTNDLVADLKDIREDAIEHMQQAQRDLDKRRGEHDSILANRSRMFALFDQHQDQLQRTANALLAKYRAANRQARSSDPPARFDHPFVMERIRVDVDLPASL